VRASLDAGCNAHLAKPVEREVLLDTLYHHTSSFEGIKLEPGEERPLEEELAAEIAALVPQYLASKWKQLDEARERLSKHDLEPIRRFGHNLGGTARGYGFPPLERIGTELEAAAASGEEARIAEQLERLRQFMEHESIPA